MALTGDLRNIGLADLFQTLHQNRATGILEVASGEACKKLMFTAVGVTLTSRRNMSGFRMGKRLVGLGKVTSDDIRDALGQQESDGGLLGEILVARGCCALADIQEVIRYHVEEELFELFTWTEGTFSFHEGTEPSQEELDGPYSAVSIEPGQAILDAARRIDECRRSWDQLPSRAEILAHSIATHEPLDEAEWSCGARALYDLLDGTRTIESLLGDAFISEFEAVPALVEMLNRGLIRKRTVSELTSTASVLNVREEHDRAVLCLKAALVERPDDIDLLTTLCTTYEKMGDKRATASVLTHIAQLRYGSKNFEAAAELLTRAARYAPGSPEIHEQLAMVLSQSGDNSGAISAYLSASDILNEDGKFNAAIDICALGLHLDPNNIKLRNNLANSYLGANDPQAAVEQLIQLAPFVESSGTRRQVEDIYRRILQLDSSRREYLARLERVTLDGIRKRKQVRIGMLAAAAVLIISGLAVVVVPGGPDTETLLAEAWTHLDAGNLADATRLADQVIQADPDSDDAFQARNILASAERSEHDPSSPRVEARVQLEEGLEALFGSAHRRFADGNFEQGMAKLLEAVSFLQSEEAKDLSVRVGKRDAKAILSGYRKQAEDLLKAYISDINTIVRKAESNLADLRRKKDSNDVKETTDARDDAEELMDKTDPRAHEQNSSHAERVEIAISGGTLKHTRTMLKAIDELRRVNDEVTERYHTLDASVMRSSLYESFPDRLGKANDLKYKGRLKDAREICALYLADCEKLRGKTPAGFYAPVAELLFGEEGHNLDGRMAAEMESIDRVLGDLELAERSILEGRHDQANALLRSLIRDNVRIDFSNLIQLVLWVRTSPPGAAVTMSWNERPETLLGRTGEEGILVRYPPHGPTVVNIQKDTFETIRVEIRDFTEDHPAAPLYRLHKLAEWKAEGLGPQQAHPVIHRDSLLLAGRDGHLRTLALSTGQPEIDHDHGLLSGFAAPPLMTGDIAWLACLDNRLLAFDLESREVLHDIKAGDRFRAAPLIVGENIIVVDEQGLVRALNSGREVWTQSLNGRAVSSPVASERGIYVSTSTGSVHALAPLTGEILWSVDIDEPLNCPLVLDPVGRPIVASDSGNVRLLAAADGHEVWRAHLDNATRGLPAVHNNQVWVCTLSGGIYAISLEDGAVVERFTSLHELPIERGPLFDDDDCFYIVDGNGKLACMDLTGQQLWRVDLESSSTTAPVTRNGRVYIATAEGAVYCFRR